MKQKTFTKAEIESVLGVSRGRLQEWVREGHIEPYSPPTQGKAALFDRLNLYQIHLFAHLLRVGFSRADAAELLDVVETNKYLCYNEEKSSHPKMRGGGWTVVNSPPQYKKDRHKFFCIISFKFIRAEVDEELR